MITINSFQLRPGTLQPGNTTQFYFDLNLSFTREDDYKLFRIRIDLKGDDNTDRSPARPVNPSPTATSYQPNESGDPTLQNHIYELLFRPRPSWFGGRRLSLSDKVLINNYVLDEDQLDEIPDESPAMSTHTPRPRTIQFDEPYFKIKIYGVDESASAMPLAEQASNVRMVEYAPH